jgi:hypothetical protein
METNEDTYVKDCILQLKMTQAITSKTERYLFGLVCKILKMVIQMHMKKYFVVFKSYMLMQLLEFIML